MRAFRAALILCTVSASPNICSGLMYVGVPSANPVCVNLRSLGPAASAMPKSATLA